MLRRDFPLFSALFCRRRYAATFLPALYRLSRLSPIPRLLLIAADMPQRFYPRFTACRDFPLFPACFLLPPICRNALARALLFVASFPRPFRFLSPPCAEVRSFALRFVPPLLAAFSRARKRAGAFCCPRTDGESLRAKKTAPLTDQEITLAAKNKTNPRIGQIRQYRGICRWRAGIDPPAQAFGSRSFGSR